MWDRIEFIHFSIWKASCPNAIYQVVPPFPTPWQGHLCHLLSPHAGFCLCLSPPLCPTALLVPLAFSILRYNRRMSLCYYKPWANIMSKDSYLLSSGHIMVSWIIPLLEGSTLFLVLFFFFSLLCMLLWWIFLCIKRLHIFGLCSLDGFPEIELLSQRAWIFLMLLIHGIYLF